MSCLSLLNLYAPILAFWAWSLTTGWDRRDFNFCTRFCMTVLRYQNFTHASTVGSLSFLLEVIFVALGDLGFVGFLLHLRVDQPLI